MTIHNFDLENVGQSHRVRLSQWFHLTAISKSMKLVLDIYTPPPAVSEILIFELFDLENVGRGHGE